MSRAEAPDTPGQARPRARWLAGTVARLIEFLRRLSIRSRVKVAIIIVAALLALFPPPAAFVERYYSNGLYPALQSAVASVSEIIPFAIIDLLVAALVLGVPAWWIIRIAKAGKGRRRRAAARLLFNTMVIAALAFLGFQLLWGLNYSRRPLAAKLDYDEERLTPEASKQMKRLAVERLDATYSEARADWPDENEWRAPLQTSLDQVVKQLGNRHSATLVPPKKSLLDFYLLASGIEGFVNPFGYEVILESELLPFEKPFLLAHEWSHLAGFADESEASFVALLACLRSEMPALEYSGWLALYQYTPWPVTGSVEEIKEALRVDPPPRPRAEVIADLTAIRERAARYRNSLLSRAQWAIYDGFLKANRVRAGVGSYGRVTRLVLGTRFESGWTPALRSE